MLKWFQKHLQGELRQAAFKQGFWATLIQVVEAARGFLIVPLAVYYIGLGGYGLWLTTYGFLQALTMLDLGLTGPFQRAMANAYARDDKKEFSKILSVGLMIAGTMSSIILFIGLIMIYVAQQHFPRQTAELPMAMSAFLAASVASSLSIINTFLRASGSAQLKPTAVMLPMLMFRLLGISLTVVLFVLGIGALAIGSGLLFAEFGILMAYLWMTARDGEVAIRIPSFAELNPWLEIAKITFLSRMLGGASERLETTIIGMLISVEMASIFSIGKKLATFIDQILHTMWASLMSPLTNFAAHNDKTATARKFSWTYGMMFRASLSMYVGYLFINAWFIKYWIGEQVLPDKDLYLLIGLSMASTFIFDVLNETIMLLNQPTTAGKQYMAVAALRLLCMAALGWQWGVNGMVGGIFCANLFGITFAGQQVKNHLRRISDSRNISKIALYIMALALLTLIGWNFGGLDTTTSIVPTILVLIFVALHYGVMEWLDQRALNAAGPHDL
jgi:O-antigen/teichoic acid export membrane protein